MRIREDRSEGQAEKELASRRPNEEKESLKEGHGDRLQ